MNVEFYKPCTWTIILETFYEGRCRSLVFDTIEMRQWVLIFWNNHWDNYPFLPCLPLIVRRRTMGKLVSIVTTYLVVLSSRFYFWKNWLRRRIPRWTVMSTTDRRGGLVPKYLDFWNLGTKIDSLNFVTEWQDGPSHAWRAVIDPSVKSSLWTLWRKQQDGPSQARRAITGCVIPGWVGFR